MAMDRIIPFLIALMAVQLVCADDRPPTKELIAEAVEGEISAQFSLAYRCRDGKGIRKD